jgi:hypothetical protein
VLRSMIHYRSALSPSLSIPPTEGIIDHLGVSFLQPLELEQRRLTSCLAASAFRASTNSNDGPAYVPCDR